MPPAATAVTALGFALGVAVHFLTDRVYRDLARSVAIDMLLCDGVHPDVGVFGCLREDADRNLKRLLSIRRWG